MEALFRMCDCLLVFLEVARFDICKGGIAEALIVSTTRATLLWLFAAESARNDCVGLSDSSFKG